MKNGEETFFTVGELARRCGVTVRTLQYYDKEGLLSPTHYTEGGRRLYAREDIFLLQQILFLKSFGFSLQDIRDRLLHAESPEQIGLLFARQRDALKGQIEELTGIVDLLDKTIAEIGMNGELGAEKLVAIIEMMKLDHPYPFILRYFGREEMKTMMRWFDGDDDTENLAAQWQDIFSDMIELYKNGADPCGPEGQALAARWWEQVQKMTKSDPEMLKTLMEMGSDVDNWPDEAGDFKDAAKDFLSKAFDKYLRDNGMMPEGMEEHE